ncbi:hypothetical protein Trydic_g18993 [Trypoxylus dichotomus]
MVSTDFNQDLLMWAFSGHGDAAVERESRQQTSTNGVTAPLNNYNKKKLNPKIVRPKQTALLITPAQGKTYTEVLSEMRQRQSRRI